MDTLPSKMQCEDISRVELGTEPIQFEKETTEEPDLMKMKMACGSFYISKEDRNRPIDGEDSHFICAEENVIGVADGVGGCRKRGIDSGVFARKLMNNSVAAVHYQHINSGDSNVDPKKVLNEAYSYTKDVEGLSTACIVALNNKERALHYVNVGDSGFMLFRNKKLIYKSPIQQHRFNCPFSLGEGHTLDLAMEDKLGVIPGDVIVLGTDGLLDNVYPSEIEEILENNTAEDFVEPELLAWIIAEELALRNSEDAARFSPYAIASHQAGKSHIGGKIDDITVIVGHIIA